MAIPELLDQLLRAHGPTGHEQLAYDVVRAAVEGTAEVESDTAGNLYVRRSGGGDAPLLAIFAHLDVIGLAVAHVQESGMLAVHKLAASQPAIAWGQRVEIRTADGSVPGVVARSSKEPEKVEWDELFVDIGARDGDEARTLVAPGDPMVFVAPPLELANGRVASRNMDNRASLYVALEAFSRLAADGVDVAVVASAQEELGHHGARVAAHRLRPEVALAIDVTYATDLPAGDPNESGDHRLGGGPAIFRGPAVNPRLFELMLQAAKAEGIAHTVETGSKTSTDGDDTFSSRDGIATALVSIPLRNMHSAIETLQLSDVEDCIRLVVAFARLLEPGANLAR